MLYYYYFMLARREEEEEEEEGEEEEEEFPKPHGGTNGGTNVLRTSRPGWFNTAAIRVSTSPLRIRL